LSVCVCFAERGREMNEGTKGESEKDSKSDRVRGRESVCVVCRQRERDEWMNMRECACVCLREKERERERDVLLSFAAYVCYFWRIQLGMFGGAMTLGRMTFKRRLLKLLWAITFSFVLFGKASFCLMLFNLVLFS